MKRFVKSVSGVTLLEIMLVLAIAAMIVVMSIRYYQSASSSQQANAAAGQVQAIMAAMDNLGTAGGYSGNATQENVASIVGKANMVTPTGGNITVTPKSATAYTASFPLNETVCPSVEMKLRNTPKATTRCSGGTLTLDYDAAK